MLLPWEFSPLVLAACLGALFFYLRGWRRNRRDGHPGPGTWGLLGFLAGLLLIYGVMQTRFDYLAQHMLWIHRLQHLVLHHLGPFLIIMGGAHPAFASGLPVRLRDSVLFRNPPVRALYRLIQHPLVACILFVGLIAFWLIPEVHFTAMLSARRYQVMNWSMLIDGLLFWWLALEIRPVARGRTLGYGTRMLMLLAVVPPQIYIGAHIALADHSLYSVYNVCGRAWPIDPLVDQEIAGIITWIPAAMMSGLGLLVVLARWMHASVLPAPAGGDAAPAG